MPRIVLDTNVFVAALRSQGGASRQLLRRALEGRLTLLFGNALWLEYEDLLGRDIWDVATTDAQRRDVLDAIALSAQWVNIHFGWRPNLPDESDNHLIELAIAGSANAIVTHNVRDLIRGELAWPHLRVLTPATCLEELT